MGTPNRLPAEHSACRNMEPTAADHAILGLSQGFLLLCYPQRGTEPDSGHRHSHQVPYFPEPLLPGNKAATGQMVFTSWLGNEEGPWVKGTPYRMKHCYYWFTWIHFFGFKCIEGCRQI